MTRRSREDLAVQSRTTVAPAPGRARGQPGQPLRFTPIVLYVILNFSTFNPGFFGQVQFTSRPFPCMPVGAPTLLSPTLQIRKMKPTLATYRAILRELRWLKLQNPVRNDVLSYVSKEFKANKTTDEKFCRASESAVFRARTYLTLLESTRRNQMLTELYKGRGDKTTEQAANTVGLTLPKTYQG